MAEPKKSEEREEEKKDAQTEERSEKREERHAHEDEKKKDSKREEHGKRSSSKKRDHESRVEKRGERIRVFRSFQKHLQPHCGLSWVGLYQSMEVLFVKYGKRGWTFVQPRKKQRFEIYSFTLTVQPLVSGSLPHWMPVRVS